MDETLLEFVTSAGVEMRVDRQHGIIRGVKLLGLESRNGRKYLPAALTQAAPLYEGAKVNVNHPKGHPLSARDYQDRLGAIRNVEVRGNGLFGDFHFNPKHALAEQLVWDAIHAPDNVGFSHNVSARTSRQGGQTVVEAILKVQSVDLVADPATTRGLYENTTSERPAGNTSPSAEALASLSLATLREQRPDLFEAIGAELSVRIATLQSELDRCHAQEAVQHRSVLAEQLLQEYQLPAHGASSPHDRAIVSELFWEMLLAAKDESAMRALVSERAAMVASARRFEIAAPRGARPVSREQNRPAPGAVFDARSFARAIS